MAPTSPDGGIVQTRMTDELMPMQTRDGFDLQLLVGLLGLGLVGEELADGLPR